jgi:hypothetical protein
MATRISGSCRVRSSRVALSRTARLAVAALVAATALVAAPVATRASSDFGTGTLHQRNPISGSEQSLGVCRLFLGPRDFIADGEFMLEIGDVSNGQGKVQQLFGTATPDGQGGYFLSADDEEAQAFYQQVLRDQLDRPDFAFQLTGLEVEVFKTEFDRGPQAITCEMRLQGFLIGSARATFAPVVRRGARVGSIAIGSRGTTGATYSGAGLAFPGIGAGDGTEWEVAASAAGIVGAQDATCPRPDFAPVPSQCTDPSCLVTFAGYQWWTEYEYWGPDGGYFYNNGNAWSPKNVTVDAEGMHLRVQIQDVGAGNQWTAAEAVTALNPDGTVAHFGYGTYLVTATIKTAPSWDAMDPNVAFGAFTYERDKTGTTSNPGREIDLAEVSRWGRVDGQPCRNIPLLCTGNSQFTLQIWNDLPANLHRYTISQPGPTITLVMEWTGANQPVTFKQFNGVKTLSDDLSNPANTWTTAADQNPYIPASNCEQFHLNFWMGNQPESKGSYNPPPASPQEVVVTNFQFKPLGS